VCDGTGCKVKFKDVSFKECTLVVLDGACVTLTNTNYTFDASYSHGLAVFASGYGTKVHMHGCCITGGTKGATVQVCDVLSCTDYVFMMSYDIIA
jgi:hypothetical protein